MDVTKVIFNLARQGEREPLEVTVSCCNTCLTIAVKGYGECCASDGDGSVILLEHYDGELRAHLFNDINSESPITRSLEGAREDKRINDVDISGT